MTTFAAEIAAHQGMERVESPVTEVAFGGNRVLVRERGSIITECRLVNPHTQKPVDVLFCDDPTASKPNASFPMSPVGPYDGIGGQHGPFRWADFAVISRGETPESAWLATQARRSDEGLALARAFILAKSGLTIESELQNPTGEVQKRQAWATTSTSLPLKNTCRAPLLTAVQSTHGQPNST